MKVFLCLLAGLLGCRDLSGFTTAGESYAGDVVGATFVRAGVGAGTKLCLTLDADHLQDSPGNLSTSDGRFHAAAMRSVPQVWQDPLSTLTFGEGRLRNLVYIVSASTPFGDGNGSDVLAIVSLMQSGDVEVRLIRGAPGAQVDAGAGAAPAVNVFAVFDLTRQKGPCSF